MDNPEGGFLNKLWASPIICVLIAIAVTTTMDATGLTAFSALPLFPLMLIYWLTQGIDRRSMGFTWGPGRYYFLATLYPLVVLGLVGLTAALGGAVNLSDANWKTAAINIGAGTLGTFLVTILTEEGFFRGWLWASLKKRGLGSGKVLIASSVAFALWHLSWVTLTADRLPLTQIPVFILNAALLGTIWGLLRWGSGSIIVASLSHGVWNGLAYTLFGFGTNVGALGIKETALHGPEIGITGLVFNMVYALVLWRWVARQNGTAFSNETGRLK